MGAYSTSQQPGYPQRVLGEQSQLQQAAHKAQATQKSAQDTTQDRAQTLAQAPRGAPIH